MVPEADRVDPQEARRREELAWVERARRGDETAFRWLIRRYQRAVYGIALRMLRDPEEAQDVSQDVFLRVFSHLDRFDPNQSLSTWIYRITSNRCIDLLRKRRQDTVSLDEPLGDGEGAPAREIAAPDPDPLVALERKEAMERVEAALERLPEPYRAMLVLRHQEHLSYEAIAEALEIPLGTVKARIHRARARLRELLEET
jgi:RNA polymerase sigma-70 factor (ECF subfamily)